MPDKDVVIRGTWGKVEVNKAADGTLREALTLYKQVEEDTKSILVILVISWEMKIYIITMVRNEIFNT